ncbi:apoptosis inhibitor 5-like protein API5 [Histomonas meleagridis]|uniref:apoptosis inhibitor 5-like protein API5 n=1 Tax=Histomonas meleagridis TaxID=135588 RepID=UPI0035597D6D|nr:apoptosis inhibitor 5-like protein API5 [Histomonas meleagridis]KAH0798933.1 apoptosis inhibitor 5-like protein API5 [Histomonas meleagridis]
MAPKAKVAITAEMLYDCNERMGKTDTPDEGDFKKILSGAESPDMQVKSVSAQLIPRYSEKFPKLTKNAVTAMVNLSKVDDPNVRLSTVKGIIKFYDTDKQSVTSVLLERLADEDTRIIEYVQPAVKRYLESDEEFRNIFFSSLQKQTPETQCKMVDLIRDEIKFTEETVPQLLEVLQVAFKSCVIEGLRLYGKNKKLISEEQFQPLIDNLLELLDNSLQSNFDDVIKNLMVQILRFTNTIGDSSTSKLLDILTTRVMPKFDSLPIEVKIAVMQKIADISRIVESEDLLIEIYNKVFLTFPKTIEEKVNLSLIEATLFAFCKLSQRFSKTASKLIGTVLIRTGQPGESDEVNEDESKQNEFRERIDNIIKICDMFLETCKGKYTEINERKTSNEEETRQKRKDLKDCIRAQKTGVNTVKMCRMLVGRNPLSGKIPGTPSWSKKKAAAFKKGKKNGGQQRRNERRERMRRNRYNNHDNSYNRRRERRH